MKIKTYRICLLSLVILIVIGGVFYFMNSTGNNIQAVDGTFVEKIINNRPLAGMMERWMNYGR